MTPCFTTSWYKQNCLWPRLIFLYFFPLSSFSSFVQLLCNKIHLPRIEISHFYLVFNLYLNLFFLSSDINPTSSSEAVLLPSSSLSSTILPLPSPSHSSSLLELAPSWTFVSHSFRSAFASGMIRAIGFDIYQQLSLCSDTILIYKALVSWWKV